ncbi:VOC family protein [Candidatus Protochlamydia phocaeensis]|uniref:VOC family protein n=1 Tax=Candidatus Protochlamydia phocaeensis TaxID=1414722 RepID=UPI000838D032|nr:VOC family protein [Candidatus Protochlamydia phocaeensis]
MKKVKQINLSWIVVSDLAKAKAFFTECVGLKVSQDNGEHGWLELSGHDGGALLGVAQASENCPIPPGYNAITTFTVDNIKESADQLARKGIALIGDVLEVPGVVKLQLFKDADGNHFQFAQNL